MQLLEADDLATAAGERLHEYDEAFFVVLQRYLRAAQQKGDTHRVERLQALMEAVREAMESQLPPSLQLLTRLARAKTSAESDAILEAQRALLDDAFLQQFDAYLDSVKEHLAPEELARLQEARAQAQAKMAIQRG